MKKVAGAMLVVAMLSSGCASSDQPAVAAYPMKGQSPEQQTRDANDCHAWARQQTGYDPGTDTANAGKGAAIGAVVGGVGGTAAGAGYGYTKSKEGFDRAYAACMGGKGY